MIIAAMQKEKVMIKKLCFVMWVICLMVSIYLAHKRYIESASIWQLTAALYMFTFARNRVKRNVHIRRQRKNNQVVGSGNKNI